LIDDKDDVIPRSYNVHNGAKTYIVLVAVAAGIEGQHVWKGQQIWIWQGWHGIWQGRQRI
jgi:hypothetical protein